MNQPVRYIAEIRQVREVALDGSADLTYWSDKLLPGGFRPVAKQDKAQIVLTSVAARWMSVAFRELSIGVLVRADWNVGREEGICLLRALNSSRVFAYCERRFFHTPYRYADVQVDADSPVSMEVSTKHQHLFTARMRGDPHREPIGSAEATWEGPIYLPPRIMQGRKRPHLFWAKLAGATSTYSFDDSDSAQLCPAEAYPALEALLESGFAGERWRVRQSATHARSKTVFGDGA